MSAVNRFGCSHLHAPNPSHAGIPRRLSEALSVLLQAHDYADEIGVNDWDLAMEIESLRATGATTADFRWLVCKQYVEHACESTGFSGERRSFQDEGKLTFTEKTCFVLTPSGVLFARRACSDVAEVEVAHPTHETISAVRAKPTWDAELRELRFCGALIKEFRGPATNQQRILSAFEEEKWPHRIDDPLPQIAPYDPKRRLHDTIVSLNKNQKTQLIRFRGDGTGEGVCWISMETNLSNAAARRNGST